MLCVVAAAQADAVPTLLGCLTAASGDVRTVNKSLHIMTSLLAADSSKTAFMRANGANQLTELLSSQSGKEPEVQTPHLAALLALYSTGLASIIKQGTSCHNAAQPICL